MTEEKLVKLLGYLIAQPQETEWLEFKKNNFEKEECGELICGLANTANLFERDFGYLVYGVEDNTHKVIGTTVSIKNESVGKEPYEHRLVQRLNPTIDIRIHEFKFENKPIVIVEVPRAVYRPVQFLHIAYIRIDSITRKLKDFSEKERKIRHNAMHINFESEVAMGDVNVDEILKVLDFASYFKLTQETYPENKSAIIEKLLQEKFVQKNDLGTYDILNLGAILFAHNLKDFATTKRKGVRIITYKGKDKSDVIRELKANTGDTGYALSFSSLVDYIVQQIPSEEIIINGLRQELSIPEISVREILANTLIHQDFFEKGTGPMVEIFSDRIEITNPGKPIIETTRFLDHAPKSRNEDLASFMRRIKVCEERGHGVDKAMVACEVYKLPSLEIEDGGIFTRVTLYQRKSLKDMTELEKSRTTYRHCSLKYVQKDVMTNSSLRERLGIKDSNYPIASKIISTCLEKGRIKPFDPDNNSKKHAKYIPFRA